MNNTKTIQGLASATEALLGPSWTVEPTPPKPTMVRLPADTVMEAVERDVHHHGASEWGILNRDLYTRHRMSPPSKWVKVRRVSFTPRRILLLAQLILETTVEPRERATDAACDQALEDFNQYGSGE